MEPLIVLTGMTGKTGRYCLEKMIAEKEKLANMRFRAIVRPGTDASRLRECGLPIEVVIGAFEDAAFLGQALLDADVLLHTAGIHWSKELVSAAVKNSVARIIVVHTTGIYSRYKEAGEGYRQIDTAVERIARDGGASLTVLRPTMVYGSLADMNMCKFIRMVDKLPFIPVVGGGRYAIQPIHQRDLGEAYFTVLMHPAETDGKQYVLSGEKPIELREALAVIAKALGKKPRFLSIPFWLAYAGAVALYGLSLTKIDFREKVQRLVEPRAYPHDAAAADFGFAPRPFTEDITAEVTDYCAQRE